MPSPAGYTPSVVIPLSQDYLVDALLFGTAWQPVWDAQSLSWQNTLTYSFITPGQSQFSASYSDSNEYLSAFALSGSQATAVANVLASWSAVANIRFTAVDETASSVGDLRFGGYSGMKKGTLAWAYFPSNGPAGGDVWIGPATSSADTSAGSNDFLTLLHEVGHALGLKHNFSTSSYNSATLTNSLDEVAYTVMSYNDAYSFYPTTPMLLDVAAIQYIYGTNYSWNQGDTTYTWGADQHIFETIWDGGGNDTIDASNQLAAVRINLNEGAYSNIGKTFIDYLYGNYQFNQGLAIAYGAQIENAIGSNYNDTLVGNALANVLTGGAGDDRLDGGAGADTLIGGLGNDTYVVDNASDRTEELAGEGTDTVNSSLSWILGAHLENLLLTGTAAINGTGNSLDNIITGNNANNVLNGGVGADTLIGGLGNDTYVVDNIGDITTELSGQGTDTVSSSISWTLAANLENLTLTGSADINGTGNTLRNSVTGNDGNNILDGRAGVDTLAGGLGDDTYIVDLIQSGSGSTATAALEDSITETTGAGTDTLQLRGTLAGLAQATTLTLGSNLENLDASATGTTRLNLTGNTANNIIVGNDADNRLNGGTGADTLIGGKGNDTYVVDNLGDVTIEIAGQGTDTVNSGISWALGAELENLKLTGTAAINGTGNALRNSITGNDGNNILDGGAGADALAGGKGNDTYIVDLIQSGSGSTTTAALEDSITEAAGAGTDTLQLRGTVAGLAQATTLTLATDLENLDASATGTTRLNLTGNTANNIIIGNDADNRLNGGAGADTLRGGLGNDTYIVDSTSDRIEELSNQGIDTVNSGLSWTLGDHLENLTLTGTAAINGTGNSLDNQITGNSANNVLNGGLGADILIGGKGNDTYVVDNLGDIITELAGQGTDTVNSSLSWTLAAELENLKLTGTAAINGTGNALRNSITGNKANNILDGRAGVDTLAGGLGDDTYIVDLIQSGSGSTATAALEDSITEAASAGIDTLQLRGVLAELAKVTTLTLATDLENLDASATGTTRLNITGNTANNIIIGNDADNRLNGGTGIDTLIGGKGNDTYVLDNANELNLVQELADEGTDTLQIAYSNTSTKVAQNIDLSSHQHLENVKITGTGLFNLTGNEANNVLTGNAANNRLDGGTGADTLIGGLGNDTYVVDNLNDLITELAGQGTDTVNSSLSWTLGAELENLVLTGTVHLDGTGNTLRNSLTGNDGNNILDGGAGADTLIGGRGNDLLIGNLGADILTGGEGADVFLFQTLSELGLGTKRDVINDFNASEGDLIDLSALDANGLLGGNNTFTFIGSASFTGLGQLRFQNQILYGNLSGDLQADFEIKLLGVSSLDASSLVV